MSLLRSIFSFVLLMNLTRAVQFLKTFDVVENKEILPSDVKIDYRLSENVTPSYYRIKLDPDISNKFNFLGESCINITVKESLSNTIILHSKELTYDETVTSLIDPTGKIIVKPIKHSFENVTDFLILTFAKNITAGKYTLKLNYTGTLIHDDFNGFYRSSYKNDQGNDVWLATTHFEPTHARLAFPCFDEPAMKAKFEISIKHFENYTASSNMPAVSQTRENNDFSKWWTNFDVTPVMSTYLVAFVISDFTYLSNTEQTFKVWSRDNAIHLGQYARAVGQLELEELENYVEFDYAIPKMDNFAIPQFRGSAMENWGIVTYRESALLFDKNVTTTENKQGIATLMSHEFAHQWFGNLVSPKWWDFTWLNEGFANYFEYFITDKVERTWHLMDQFVIKNLQETAFEADDNKDQHPMDAMVNSSAEISKNFDSISYSKAGCVIRMISHALRESVFQNGLNNYLTKMKYSSANSDDLFDALAEGKNVPKDLPLQKALKSWSTQAGYPVVTVIRDHKAGTAKITQKRFLTEKFNETFNETWWIPFNYATNRWPNFFNTSAERWVTDKIPASTILSGLRENEWLIVNVQQTGYYRVNYDIENWKLIAEYLRTNYFYEVIHKINRAQLLDDSFKLAQAGELEDHRIFFEISVYLQNEDDYVPWYAANRAFFTLNIVLSNTEKYDLFKLYVLRLLGKLEKRLGYAETVYDDHLTKLKRINAINLACMMGSKKCLDATHEKLIEYLNDSNKISTNLRSVVLCSGFLTADAKIWESTYNLISGGKESADRASILNALGCTSNEEKLRFYLNQTLLTDSGLMRKDVIKAVYVGSPVGVDIVFDFLRDNFKVIIDADGDTKSVEGYFNDIGSRMTTVAQIDKLEKFIQLLICDDKKELADALKAKALVSANANLNWLKKYEAPIGIFLDAQKLVEEKDPTTEKPNGSNVSLPTISLTAFMILINSVANKVHGS